MRVDLPVYDTRELAAQWRSALALATRLGELGHPCSMGMGTRRMLFQIIRAMGAKTVLDIGTFTGTSALNYALAVGEGGHVTTVDIKDINALDAHWREWKRPRSPNALMEAAGVADRVTFVTQDAVDYMIDGPRFDFISIDGWHEDFAVFAEISVALKRLNPDGLIFLDDVQSPESRPPAGCDVITGPWRALGLHPKRGVTFDVRLIWETMEGQRAAIAFLLAKP